MSMQLQLWSPAHLCQRRSCSRGTLLLAEEPPHSGNPGLQFLELCIPRVAACVGLVNWLFLLLNFADRPSEANPINNSAID